MFVVKNVYSQVTVEIVDNVESTREGARQESHSTQSTQDGRKLLKRTKSLAVISEDESRQDRERQHFKPGQSTFDLPRGHQLIPRAKLIDRNSLKDRLSKSQQHLSESTYERFNDTRSYHSRSTCGLHSIPPALDSLPDPLSYSRANRTDQTDRLNILDWPEPPRRYRSVQALDTVSGLVDIVEDNWPIEGNRSIDCIYTQVKRKRKEHRSLDSILFEDDGELEYFDVLNLLPLSNVRLEFDERDARNNNLVRATSKSAGAVNLRALEYHTARITEEHPSLTSTVSQSGISQETIETEETDSLVRKREARARVSAEFHRANSPSEETSSARYTEIRANCGTRRTLETYTTIELTQPSGVINHETYEPDAAQVIPHGVEVDRKIDEAEDYKAIWILDKCEHAAMSRRPQVLKVVDNDVTKRWHRHSSVEGDALKVEVFRDSKFSQHIEPPENDHLDISRMNSAKKTEDVDGARTRAIKEGLCQENKDKVSVENTRNFLENGIREEMVPESKSNGGRFERIVKETSNILGKACSAVKGSLGFEARSESSDLGLGSDCGSDSRRRSVDDGIGEDQPSSCEEKTSTGKLADAQSKSRANNITRSRSCLDGIECQDDGAEFDHVRYKIIKSNVFSKSIVSSGKRDVTYEGLMQYLREYSFQELLLDNNVVIIEPVRAETIERKNSSAGKSRPGSTCKVAGTLQKKTEAENLDKSNEMSDGSGTKSPKQSTIRKHFFYHPIRVNRELIDEELPDPDTVRNVRRMFENTLKPKSNTRTEFSTDCGTRKSASMKDLSTIGTVRIDEMEKDREGSRSRCSSRAKDLTRLFENLEKSTSSNASMVGGKDELDSPRSDSKTRILAQSFEARSGLTSPSDSTLLKNKANRYNHHNWDSGSVSSGVSSDYPDTDPGSGAQCTSSEDEEADCHNDRDHDHDSRSPGHYVSQDVLRKIRECGTSVTYYGGKVVNMCNGPLISPLMDNRFKRVDRSSDYVKFRLVKSNSCDSRLELTGRLIEGQSRYPSRDRATDLSRYAIAEAPSIEITTLEKQQADEKEKENERKKSQPVIKREPPMVIGLEPKRDDNRETRDSFKADFKLGNLEDAKSTYPSRFVPSALTRWQVNENNWKGHDDFGKMEFEEFEVLEDSLNGTGGRQRSGT